MARKHSKAGVIKAPTERRIITPERIERRVITNPTTGLVEVQRVVIPAVIEGGKATASTRRRGAKNVVPDKKGGSK